MGYLQFSVSRKQTTPPLNTTLSVFPRVATINNAGQNMSSFVHVVHNGDVKAAETICPPGV